MLWWLIQLLTVKIHSLTNSVASVFGVVVSIDFVRCNISWITGWCISLGIKSVELVSETIVIVVALSRNHNEILGAA